VNTGRDTPRAQAHHHLDQAGDSAPRSDRRSGCPCRAPRRTGCRVG
jgi:hypothetical protein